MDPDGYELFLRSFGDDAEVNWVTKFATDLAKSVAPIANILKCFIEPHVGGRTRLKHPRAPGSPRQISAKKELDHRRRYFSLR